MFENVSYAHPIILITYLAITLAALITVARSTLDFGNKLVWAVVIVVLPLVGPAAWWVALALHNRKAHASA